MQIIKLKVLSMPLKTNLCTTIINSYCFLGGITGAGARITGTVGDVFAKLTFDEEFIDKRQQQKTRPPRLGSKLGGFAKVGCQYPACTCRLTHVRFWDFSFA